VLPPAAVTFGWLVPMTAVRALALAVATVTRSANVGMVAGLAGWGITVLAEQAAGAVATPGTGQPLVALST
jgi:hypothetical protein